MTLSKFGDTGGHETVVKNISLQLVRMGHSVTIGAFSFTTLPPKEIDIINLNRLNLIADNSKYDVIHNHQTSVNYYSILLNKPFIFHYHGASNKVQEINLKLSFFICRKRITQVISVSDSALLAFKNLVGKYARNIPTDVTMNGVNTKLFSINLGRQYTKGDPQLLFVGNLYKHKNVSKLIDSISIIKEWYPNVHLQVVGSGKEFERLKQQVVTGGNQSHIDLVGPITDSGDLSARYSSCDIYISASMREALCLPPLEAMSCGKPILLSDIPTHTELVCKSKAGLTFSLNEKDSVLKGINQILQNRTVLKFNAENFAKKNDWSNVSIKIIKIYEKLLNKGN